MLFALAGVWVSGMDGYVIVGSVATDAVTNPFTREVVVQAGAWMQNYNLYPWMIAAPVLGLVMCLLTAVAAKLDKGWVAFLFSSLAIAGIILTAGFSMFPVRDALEPRAVPEPDHVGFHRLLQHPQGDDGSRSRLRADRAGLHHLDLHQDVRPGE